MSSHVPFALELNFKAQASLDLSKTKHLSKERLVIKKKNKLYHGICEIRKERFLSLLPCLILSMAL